MGLVAEHRVDDGVVSTSERVGVGVERAHVGDVRLVELVAAEQRDEVLEVGALEVVELTAELVDNLRVVVLLVERVEQGDALVLVAEPTNVGGKLVASGGRHAGEVVPESGLGDGELGVHVGVLARDRLDDVVDDSGRELGVTDVALDGLREDGDVLAEGGRGADEVQELVLVEAVEPIGQGRDGAGARHLLHAVVLVIEVVDGGVLVVGDVVVDGFAEQQLGVGPKHVGNHLVERRVHLDEGVDVGLDAVKHEAVDGSRVKRGHVAVVVACAHDDDVGRKAGGAKRASGGDGQGLRRDVGCGAVNLVEEQDGRLARVGLGVSDGIGDDGVRVEHLLVALAVLGGNQAGAREVGLVGKLVAGKGEALGAKLGRETLGEAGLADARLTNEHGHLARLEVCEDDGLEGVVELHV